jgi:hypothetical protein
MRLHAALVVLCVGAGTLASVTSLSCNDPVHDQEVAALGPEQGPPGPLHRPGQPCLTCHGGAGPAKFQMGVGGTVYENQGGGDPAPGAVVQIEDIDGTIWTGQSSAFPTLTANAAGNFYLPADNFAAHYPTQMTVTSQDGTVSQPMLTHVGRDGSCADCHTLTEGPTSAGPVYLNAASTNPDGG